MNMRTDRKTRNIMLFLLICGGIFVFYLPSFFMPPRSDYWSLFYFFHHLDAIGGSFPPWMHVMNWDPFEQVRFRPLAHLIPYVIFLLSGPEHILAYVFNTAAYCGVLYAMYRLACELWGPRRLALALLFVFAMLFSHFDMLLWPLHSYIFVGFCSMIAGFVFYIRFLKGGGAHLIVWTAASFVTGMLCYETVAVWPFAILILDKVRVFGNDAARPRPGRGCAKNAAGVLGAVYAVCAAVFILTRMIGTYDRPQIDLSSLVSIPKIAYSFFSVYFSAVYNAVLAVAPFIASPGRIEDEVYEMAGLIVSAGAHIRYYVYAGGALVAASCAMLIRALVRRHDRDALYLFLFFLFLWFSDRFILFHCRNLTNPMVFNFQQFRYQFAANAIGYFFVLYAVYTVFRNARYKTGLISGAAAVIFVLNIGPVLTGVRFVNSQMRPLQRMIGDIKEGLKDGRIDPENRLYIPPGIVDHLPPLSWNFRMGSMFMDRTYEWMFTKKQLRSFTFAPDDAQWTVRASDGAVVPVRSDVSLP
ncbi:MAG TPA: hypothetical protein PLP56_05250 [Candidatus Omnitrophota bacterium]|nr:hypothetical protein [Candidatus Omnitrophota bacterium]HQQ06369.1 hypothetical protein [Candidatus Omnitrophota bacterium]